MKFRELDAQLMADPEYRAAERKLRPYVDIARELILLRMENNMTQEALAEIAGTNQANISRVENALANPSIAFLQRLAAAFDAEVRVHLVRRDDLPCPAVIATHDTVSSASATVCRGEIWDMSSLADNPAAPGDRVHA
jgi:transcriptional regulator with XRE-family HTH domain